MSAHIHVPLSAYETIAVLLDALYPPYLPVKPIDFNDRLSNDAVIVDPDGRPAFCGWATDTRGNVVIGMFNSYWNSLGVSLDTPVFDSIVEAMVHERVKRSEWFLSSFNVFLAANQFTLEAIQKTDQSIDARVESFANRGCLYDIYQKKPQEPAESNGYDKSSTDAESPQPVKVSLAVDASGKQPLQPIDKLALALMLRAIFQPKGPAVDADKSN